MTQPIFSNRQSTPPWFWIGCVGIWMVALGLRFWGLERFNTLVFDEVYFAKFAHNYITHTRFFDAHPPLGKYLIALGIWVKGFNPWGYRWMNALTGSFIPLIVVGIGYQLTQRYRFALLAGALAVLDGLLLVESRYGLINVYLLTFGLLGHWLTLLSSRTTGKGWQHWMWLTLAGLSFGAMAAVKWNGLGFLLGLYLFWGLLQLRQLQLRQLQLKRLESSNGSGWFSLPSAQLAQLSPFKLFGYIPVVGAILYRLVWIPHLAQNPEFNFWEVQRQMFVYHKGVGSGPEIHPYCSSWFSWPLLWRPVSYFYQRATSLQEPMPMMGPPLPLEKTNYVYTVYATGNPPLWWATSLAIALILGLAVWQIVRWLQTQFGFAPVEPNPTTMDPYVPFYLATGYIANLLPWLSISRCAFLYHYMPAYLFSSLALAWLMDGWLSSPWKRSRALALTLLLLSALGFLFWLPFYLGLPLTPQTWPWRVWLPSWV